MYAREQVCILYIEIHVINTSLFHHVLLSWRLFKWSKDRYEDYKGKMYLLSFYYWPS